MGKPTAINLNDTIPAAPANHVNVKWQAGAEYALPDGQPVRDASANVPLASTSEAGLILYDASGSAYKYLGADGVWHPVARSRAAESHKFLSAYDETTGEFANAQPAMSDLSGFGVDDGTFLNRDGTFKQPAGTGLPSWLQKVDGLTTYQGDSTYSDEFTGADGAAPNAKWSTDNWSSSSATILGNRLKVTVANGQQRYLYQNSYPTAPWRYCIKIYDGTGAYPGVSGTFSAGLAIRENSSGKLAGILFYNQQSASKPTVNVRHMASLTSTITTLYEGVFSCGAGPLYLMLEDTGSVLNYCVSFDGLEPFVTLYSESNSAGGFFSGALSGAGGHIGLCFYNDFASRACYFLTEWFRKV